jgi:hypothetical protein
MNLAAVSACPSSVSLADAVAELLVLARNEAGGRCLWCHSSELDVQVAESGGETVVVCRNCGSELSGDVVAVARERCR